MDIWYLFIHLLSINVLWLYSSHFKRKAFIGNILIAGLTGMVPLLVGFYFYHHPAMIEAIEYNGIKPFTDAFGRNYIVFIVTVIAFFAFILNLAREIIKDIEDIEGDKVLKAKTLPIVIGIKSTKLISYFILASGVTGILLLILLFPVTGTNAIHPIVIAALMNVLAIVFLIGVESRKTLKKVNAVIKLAMIFGLMAPVYWKLLLIYGY